jgi:hypothetical protein
MPNSQIYLGSDKPWALEKEREVAELYRRIEALESQVKALSRK